jgi:hypothetical protein
MVHALAHDPLGCRLVEMGCIVWGYPQYFKSLTVYRINTLATPRSTRSVASHHTGVYLAVAGVAFDLSRLPYNYLATNCAVIE